MTKAERTRQFIIEQAAPVINKKGMAGTSIADIMEVTGLAKGGVYGNFENKDEICREVFDYLAQGIAIQMEREALQGVNAREKLFSLFDFYLTGSFPEGGCPILNFGTEADDTHPELRSRVADEMLTQQRRIARLVREGVAEGIFDERMNPALFATRAFAMLEGAILMARVQGSVKPLRTLVRSLKQEVEGYCI